MELTYKKCGDYYIPNLTLGDTKEYNIGKYGWLRRTYLKEHRSAMYTAIGHGTASAPSRGSRDRLSRTTGDYGKGHDGPRGRHRSTQGR